MVPNNEAGFCSSMVKYVLSANPDTAMNRDPSLYLKAF